MLARQRSGEPVDPNGLVGHLGHDLKSLGLTPTKAVFTDNVNFISHDASEDGILNYIRQLVLFYTPDDFCLLSRLLKPF